MYKVQVRARPPVNVDFPEDIERSVKGSIRFAPGVLVVTEDELKHVEKSRPDVFKDLIVVCQFKPKKKPEGAEAPAEGAPVVAAGAPAPDVAKNALVTVEGEGSADTSEGPKKGRKG